MNTLSTYILEYLRDNNEAEVLALGIFSLKKSGAKVVTSQNNILPPAKEIFLSLNPNAYGRDFIQFIAKKENYSLETAEKFIKNETLQWNTKIENQENFEIAKIGKFITDAEGYTFLGERVEDFAPDYFGLEEINLIELQRNTPPTHNDWENNRTESTSFNNMILWTFLFVLPILGLLVAGVLYSDKVFGKKSFENLNIKKGTNRIENTQAPIQTDTLKTDSIKIQNTLPKK